MGHTITVKQENSGGGANNVTINLIDALRPYEKALSVGVEKRFLDDASENLIRDRKLHLDEKSINKVKHYLEDKKFCLIKAPEGRGKTYLSKIIAYYCHNDRGMEVFFIDLKDYSGIPINSIDDKLQEWHKNNPKEYLLVIENIHAYNKLGALRELINGWLGVKGNRIWFLLNSRPTYVELEESLDWEEIVELNPNDEDINDIIDLYSKEVGQEPFANNQERNRFINRIYSNNKKTNGANLRLLKLYLETWLKNTGRLYVSDIEEQKVIERFRNLYLANRSLEEIEALWYISSLFQFDVPMPEDFTRNVAKLINEGLLRFEENKYHLPHSVDAFFLYKAICDFKHKNYIDQMTIFAIRFVNDILDSDFPKDFESDFKLLISGLITKEEFHVVIHHLTDETLAKRIITELYSGFISAFFRPKNHEKLNPSSLINYFENNRDWLKPIILELAPGSLDAVYRTFNNYLKHNIFEDIFENLNELDNYLIGNYRLFQQEQVIIAISRLGYEYKNILIKRYKDSIDLLKPSFLDKSPTRLYYIYQTYKYNLDINIIEDIFKNPDDLRKYLKHRFEINNNPSSPPRLLKGSVRKTIESISKEHVAVLEEYYNRSKNYHKINKFPFVSIEKKDLQIPISSALIHKYCEFDKAQFQQFILDLYTKKFYFDGLSWRQLNIFLRKIGDWIDETHKELFRQVTQILVKMIIDKENVFLEKPNALEKASSTHLSYFLFHLKRIDDVVYNDTISDTKMIETVKQKLDKLGSVSYSDLLLFSRFSSQDWCKTRMNNFIDKADEEQQSIFKRWHDNIMVGLKQSGKSIEPESLLAYIHNKFYNQEV